jgi:hypothetical protein
MKHESLAEISETSLIQRLVNDTYWRSTIFNIKGIDSGSKLCLSVPMNGLPGEPVGDVDILLVPPERPDQATAIEVKRIKVRNGDANKLHEFEKGVRQANLLATIGFHQAYLYILVAVDSRESNSGDNTYDDGMSPELKGQIRQLISPHKLADGVGLVHQEFVQPMDSAPLGVGSYGGHLVRLAGSRQQSAQVTRWVESKLPGCAA